jgi:hypothetical protein
MAVSGDCGGHFQESTPFSGVPRRFPTPLAPLVSRKMAFSARH